LTVAPLFSASCGVPVTVTVLVALLVCLIPTTIGQEKATNPFLRAGEPSVAKTVHKEGAAPVEVFQSLREWKNTF